MKKALIVFCLLAFCILPGFNHAHAAQPDCSEHCGYYIDIIQRLVFPALQKETKAYYGAYARIDRFDIQILSTGKTDQGDFMLMVQFMPFTGPHNSISRVNASIICTYDAVEVIRYEPVEVFEYSGKTLAARL